MVPNDWNIHTLGQICEIAIGATPSRAAPAYWDHEQTGGLHWATIRDLRTNPVTQTNERISDLGVQNSSVKLIRAGTILMSFKLTIGRIAIAGHDMYTNEAIAAFTLKDASKVDFRFLYHALPHATRAATTHSAVKGRSLNKRTLAATSIALPPIVEQRKIANILASVEKTILATKAVIAQQERVRQCLLHQLVTRGTCEHTHFAKTPLGNYPASWKIHHLEEVCTNITYGFTNPMPTADSGPWMLTARNIRDGTIDYSSARHTGESHYHALTKKSRPKRGDVLLTKDGTLGRIAVVDSEHICVNQSIAVLAPNTDLVSGPFLALVLHAKTMQRQLLREAGGSTIKHLYLSRIAKHLVPIPPKKEQENILLTFGATESSLKRAKQQLRTLLIAQIPLIRSLLLGQIRVKV